MAELRIGRIVMGVCQTNCYFIYREGGSKAIFVDPADRGAYLYDALAERGLTVSGILLTHGHFDHIWGLEELRQKSGARVYACERERELLGDTRQNVSAQAGRACAVDADVYVGDGDLITVADMTCRMIETPGHTAGSCCYYFEEGGLLLSGDTLFEESVGRTDFPTGSMSEIVRSVKEKLFSLPDETRVYPGHGAATTIAHEKAYNPFCG